MTKNKNDEGVDVGAFENTYDATRSDKIRINDDKLWRYLKEYEKPIKLISYMTSSFTVALSFLVTILTSDFKSGKKEFIFNSSTWRVLFATGFVIATYVFIYNLIKIIILYCRKKWITTESLIEKIKKEARKDA